MLRLRAAWDFLGRPGLTFYVMAGLVLDLYAGFFIFRAYPQMFGPLNRLMLLDWMATYGRFHLEATWWFFVFLALMFLLVLNTFVCTCNRVVSLLRHGRDNGDRLGRWLRFAPHVMHLAFIIILAAQLMNYVTGVNDQNNVLLTGGKLQAPGSDFSIRLDKIEVDYYSGRRLAFYRNRAIAQRIRLTITDPGGSETHKTLSINSPVWHRGYSIHLKRYHPDSKGGMKRSPYVNLIIRQDPGIRLFFVGTALFILGLAAYLVQALRGRWAEVHAR
jgi:cytochrome c biogenesis protein ResB